jgi:hypothetical protein
LIFFLLIPIDPNLSINALQVILECENSIFILIKNHTFLLSYKRNKVTKKTFQIFH